MSIKEARCEKISAPEETKQACTELLAAQDFTVDGFYFEGEELGGNVGVFQLDFVLGSSVFRSDDVSAGRKPRELRRAAAQRRPREGRTE